MSRSRRRGHDYETVYHRFTEDDLADLKPKKVFQDKWIILKKVEKRGEAHCYQVCDKKIQNFGILYLEIGTDNITSISDQVDFSMQQFSLGYSHRFTNVIDSNIINNHVFYMVTRIRPGPSLDRLLDCLPNGKMSPLTASFIAIDIFSVFELLNSSGFVLRNFDAKQWKLDVKTRMFYLDDTTDITVSSDKRHRAIDEIHILNAESLLLHWTSTDLSYAPVSFIVNGEMHRMTELDQFEVLIYVIWDWVHGSLPWKKSKSQHKTLQMKKEFLENIPDVMLEFKNEQDHWFNTAIRNLGEHLKTARLAQEKLEKQAVRGGAWCPNGPRAGALLSIINYRRIIEDFHKIVCSGRSEWSIYWRDVKMDWDVEMTLSREQKSLLKKYEERQASLKIADEWQRLCATRQHYTIMKEHVEHEKEKNQIAIDQYLIEDQEDEESKDLIEKRIDVMKEKRQKIREERAKEYEMTKDVKEEDMKFVKDELEDDEDEFKSAKSSSSTVPFSSSTPTSRAARLALRLQKMKEANERLLAEEEKKNDVKEEEPDDYEEEEEPKKKKSKKVVMEEDDLANMQLFEVKEEEPDDYDE